ncbi:hypothetical protein CK203_026291 [Vitis vinifera]|uniref:Uncharacterized protein n=1 Tax=Vitis vinifera TaxID=29760 RepID=A0A438IKY1_VITVI|nr:hypothetical protein CK203_026291 [Vitis vinifera]
MDDLFRRVNKYSMLKDDVRAATQQVLVTSQLARNDSPKGSKTTSQRRWLETIKTDPTKRDWSRKCACHKEHDHTMEQCRSLHYLLEKLVRVGHLKQYVCSKRRRAQTNQDPDAQTPTTSATPRAMINYIHGGPVDEEYNSKRKRQRLLRAASIRERINSIQP